MTCRPAIITSFLLAVFFSSLCISSSVSAVSDYSYTIDSSNYDTAITLCNSFDSTPRSCDDYKYIVFSLDSNVSDLGNFRGWINYYFEGPYSTIFAYANQPRFYLSGMDYAVLSYPNGFKVFRFRSINYRDELADPNFSLTITFTENDPAGESDCPVCPEPEDPEPCPVVPDNPYDDKLDNITLAIYTCGAVILVIYFFYCIYRMIIKTVGGV